MKVILNDGRKLPAVSLGGSEISDAGMLKIKKAESLPFVNISKDDPSVIGDWCFALGHPGGYDPRRGIVVPSPPPHGWVQPEKSSCLQANDCWSE